MEPNPACEGAYLDLAHGMPLYNNKTIHLNDETLFLKADFIFYAAGIPNVHGGSRLSTAKQNIALSKSIFEHRTFKKAPYLIVITNPVDLIAQAVYQYSGLPANKVIGTGTFLDSIRLSWYLSWHSSYHPKDFRTIVLGEHGDSQVSIYSNSTLHGQPLVNHPEFTGETLTQIAAQTKNAAFQIRETQAGTTYGVAKCAEMLLNYLLWPETQTLTLSMYTNSHYRKLLNLNQDIYIGLPVMIDKRKIIIDNTIGLTDQEWIDFRASAAILTQMNDLYFPHK